MDDLERIWKEIFGHPSNCKWYWHGNCLKMPPLRRMAWSEDIYIACSGICWEYEDKR